MKIDYEKEELAAEIKGSFLRFCQYFYPLLTSRDFIISNPSGREPHAITICKALTRAFRLEVPNHRLLISVPPGHGKPLCKESTMVLTNKGVRKKLRDICIGDEVLTHRGRFRKVTNLFNQGILPTLKIKTFGGREIISAYDHSFLTAKGWVEAKDLCIDDILATVKPQHCFGLSIKNEEARLLGYFIGDGCVSGGASNITACDLSTIEDIKYCVNEMGFQSKSRQYKRNIVKDHHIKTLQRINISGGVREWLIVHGISGKDSYTKRIPTAIIESDFESIRNFLGAYFACDGTFGHKGQGRKDFSGSITSVSKALLEDCQHLLMRLGIRSRIRKKVRNQKTRIQGDTYTSYNLELTSQDDMYNFQKQIGEYIYHNKANLLKCHDFKRLRFDNDLMPDHIISIERNESVDCMCLEVEEDHTFTANDIVVHNSTLLLMWVAWTMAHYPDSKFLYISYSVSLAAKHTETIKRIIQLPHYRYLFDVSIRHDARGKEFFQTTNGGSVSAFGSSGSIVGTDGGLPGLDRFTGGIILDDLHKIDEAHSDTIRQSVITNYRETIQQRARGIKVPFIYIGQRVHEDDLAAYLLAGKDGYQWEHVILKSIDDAGNALYPEAFPLEMLRIKQETDPYVFSSQMQQEPVPSGGSLFKPEWFELLEFEPKIIATFITADTAETQHTYNDASAFSFWGMYEIETMGRKTGEYGLHWLDATEVFVEPKDLKDAFMDFWQSCMRHPVPPLLAAIEKKSTGTTLVSILKDVRGIQIRNIERNRSSGSKTQRFLEVQPYVASRLVSLTNYARHTELCINHMSKITANDSHKRDDLCDTLSDAIKIALIDKTIINTKLNQTDYNSLAKNLYSSDNKTNRLRNNAYR